MDYKTIIKTKKSVRKYKNEPVKESEINEIINFFNTSERLDNKINTEIKILSKKDVFENLNNIAGYNGFMIEAPNYIIILSEKKPYYIENTGYIGENICLKAKDLNLDTCWITFEDSSTISKKLKLNIKKEITGIIAFGYGEKEISNKIKSPIFINNNNSKSDIKVIEATDSERKSVEEIVYMESWGNNASIDELKIRGLTDIFWYSSMAPSALNKQPWKFILDKETVILCIKTDKNKTSYTEKIDSGIIMLYFELIVDSTLFDLKWKLSLPEKDYKIPNDYKIIAYCNI